MNTRKQVCFFNIFYNILLFLHNLQDLQQYDQGNRWIEIVLSVFLQRIDGYGFKNEINGGTTRLKFQFWISFFLPRPLSSGNGSDGLTWSDLACRVRCLSVDTLVSQKYACFFANLILCSARDIIMFCQRHLKINGGERRPLRFQEIILEARLCNTHAVNRTVKAIAIDRLTNMGVPENKVYHGLPYGLPWFTMVYLMFYHGLPWFTMVQCQFQSRPSKKYVFFPGQTSVVAHTDRCAQSILTKTCCISSRIFDLRLDPSRCGESGMRMR